MPNPFGGPQGRIRDQASKTISAGVGRRGLTGPLPSFADVGFWFKASRDEAIWADQPGTIPITNNTVIGRMDNLGFDALDLDQGGGTRWLQAGGPGGGPYLQGASPSVSSTFPHTHPALGPNGASWFGIGRHPTGAGAQGTLGLYMPGFPQVLAQTIPASPLIRMDFNGTGFQTLKATAFTTEWFWAYATIDAAGNWNMQLSGEIAISGVGVFNPVPADQRIFIAATSADFLESALWPNYVLTPADIADLISYMDSEYGGAFPIP